MPSCDNCNSFVTRDYSRVFSIEGQLHGCPQCMDSIANAGQTMLARHHANPHNPVGSSWG